MTKGCTLLILLFCSLVRGDGVPNDILRVRFNIAKLDGAPEEDSIVFKIQKRLAPLGYERFKELIEAKFYDGSPFFRVVPRFVVQFGIAADPKVTEQWRNKGPIKDDPLIIKNMAGTITFATSGADTRSTQIFINLRDNHHLDADFIPIGDIEGDGMEIVNRIWNGYGEEPSQGRMNQEGIAYAEKEFPRLSIITSTEIIGADSDGELHTGQEFEDSLRSELDIAGGIDITELERLKAENANIREEVDKARHENQNNLKQTKQAIFNQEEAEKAKDKIEAQLSAAKKELGNLRSEMDRINLSQGLVEEGATSMAESLTQLQGEKDELEMDYKKAKSYFVSQIEKLENTIRSLQDQVTRRDLYISRIMQLLGALFLASIFFTLYRMYCGTAGAAEKDCDV